MKKICIIKSDSSFLGRQIIWLAYWFFKHESTEEERRGYIDEYADCSYTYKKSKHAKMDGNCMFTGYTVEIGPFSLTATDAL